jgi:hypothetical protein
MPIKGWKDKIAIIEIFHLIKTGRKDLRSHSLSRSQMMTDKKGKEWTSVFRLKKAHLHLTPWKYCFLKACEGLQKSHFSFRKTRFMIRMVNFMQDPAILFKSGCSWLTIIKSPEEYNLPKLDLLSHSPLPPSVTLLRKWSLRFTALLRYRF